MDHKGISRCLKECTNKSSTKAIAVQLLCGGIAMLMKKFLEFSSTTFEVSNQRSHYYSKGTTFIVENYRFCYQLVGCHTDDCHKAWVIYGTANPFTAKEKAVRILRANIPIKRVVRHAVAAECNWDCGWRTSPTLNANCVHGNNP